MIARFTYNGLYTSLDSYKSPFGMTSRTELYTLNTDLGFGRSLRFSDPDAYWDQVKSQLRTVPLQAGRPITILQLAGDSAGDPTFLGVLKDSLRDLMRLPDGAASTFNFENLETRPSSNNSIALYNIADPVFAAAQGAALYARRRQEVPWGCDEPKTCKDAREKQRTEATIGKSELK